MNNLSSLFQRALLSHAVLILLGAASCAYAESASVVVNQTADQQTVAVSDELLQALQEHEKTAPGQRAGRLDHLQKLGEQRRQRLLEQLQRDPKSVARHLMLDETRKRLPPSVQASVERPVDLTGTVQVVVSEDPKDQGRHLFYLKQSAIDLAQSSNDAAVSGRLQLHAVDPSLSVGEIKKMAGKRIRLAARQLGEHILVDDKKQIEVAADINSSTTSSVATKPIQNALIKTDGQGTGVTGEQKVLMVMANFTNVALESQCGKEELRARLFTDSNSVNQMYKESTHGDISLSGDVIGPFPINYDSNSCDYFGWGDALEQ